MAHAAQQHFMMSVKSKFPNYFKNKRVLDVGSFDVNGNNRYLFENDCKYLGIDIGFGRNVDIVCRIHEFKDYYGFDTIVSTECFEHDEFYILSFKNIISLLKPTGLFAFTCANKNRQEHGTRRTIASDSPFTSALPNDYYKNVTEQDVRNSISVDNVFLKYEFSVNSDLSDLYFWGIKNEYN